jgi:NAD(P)-dependent dehydrogenase (short-subunit alcohol dehydrogenase family)
MCLVRSGLEEFANTIAHYRPLSNFIYLNQPVEMQTIIVTGASSGIGLGIARYFLEKGDNVLINSSNAVKLQEAYIQLGAGENLARLAGDVGVRATGINLAAKAVEQFGAIDILVNSAGLFDTRPFIDVDESYLDLFLRTNFKGTFFTSQAVIPQMLKQKAGSIINIGAALVTKSIADFNATVAMSSKGAVHALTVQMAAEFGGSNIRVNVVAPGVIRTPIHISGGKDTADESAGLHLLRRIGEIADVAEMVYAVAKNNFINGAIINVDGGLSTGHHLTNRTK